MKTMGIYINPAGCTKEEFLKINGILLSRAQWPDNDEMALVCLVDNGPFSAAAIACSRSEMKVFNRPDDPRPMKWYWVKKEKLYDVSSVRPGDFEKEERYG